MVFFDTTINPYQLDAVSIAEAKLTVKNIWTSIVTFWAFMLGATFVLLCEIKMPQNILVKVDEKFQNTGKPKNNGNNNYSTANHYEIYNKLFN